MSSAYFAIDNEVDFDAVAVHTNTVLIHYLCVFVDQIAWALNKGVKQEYKQFWDVDLGVTYIPWEKVKLYDLRSFDKVRGAGSMHTSYVCKRRETGQQSTSVHRPFRSLY